MSVRLVLFDLDETIAADDALDRALFDELAREVASAHGVAPARLVAAIAHSADELWGRAATAAYCERLGISAWEGLWGPFAPSHDPMLAALHAFVPAYRVDAWRQAVEACGIHDAALADSLAARFLEQRRARQAAYPWSRDVLEQLRPRYRLGMITNGAPDLQRLKLAGTGLAAWFDPVIISGDLGVGKPEAAIFGEALRQAGVSPDEAVMVGDSWQRDVRGATGAGLAAVWMNPRGDAMPALPADSPPVMTAPDLRGLPALLATLDPASPA
jgi:phosphoserine phosphatase